MHQERENHVFQRTCVVVFDQIPHERRVTVVHLRANLAERDAGGVHNARLRAKTVDKADPPLPPENLHMIGRRNVHIVLCHPENLLTCSVSGTDSRRRRSAC